MKKEKVILALGGNLGDVKDTFLSALKILEESGFTLEKKSGLYSTKPVDCVPGTGDFINAVVSGYWNDTPVKLLDLTQKIEQKMGRKADHSSMESRELDIDIILFEQMIIRSSSLQVPHPRAHERLFVMVPLTEIEPDILFPDRYCTASNILEGLVKENPDAFNLVIKHREELRE